MDELPRVRLSGDVEGDYVVLQRRAGGVLRIAPERSGGLPKVVALEKTSVACPSQWEGSLEDGRAAYARYRHGHLSVGIGNAAEEAVRNSMSDRALYADNTGDGLDGFMDFEELKVHLHGLLEVAADLVVENEHPSPPDPKALEDLFQPRPGD